MGKVREKIRHAIPWVDPFIEYFDWRKRVVTALAAFFWGGWSLMSGLAWPVIAFLFFGALVFTAYALVFPAFIRLINVGVKARPDHNIWKHRNQFRLYEASCLLADVEPVYQVLEMDGKSRAWYYLLCEAIKLKEIKHVPNRHDDERNTGKDGYLPYEHTVVTAVSLRTFCEIRGRRPEFLTWE